MTHLSFVQLLILFLVLPQNPKLVVLATDGLFDTDLYKVRNFGHFFCPKCIDPAQVSGQEVKPNGGTVNLKETVYTSVVKDSLKAQRKGPKKKKTKVCRNKCCLCCCLGCLSCWLRTQLVLTVGLTGFAAVYGLASANRKPAPEVAKNSQPKVVPKNPTPDLKMPEVGGPEVLEIYQPPEVKTINLWESIVNVFESNPVLFAGEAILIVILITLLVYHLIESKRRFVEEGNTLTIEGVQCGLKESPQKRLAKQRTKVDSWMKTKLGKRGTTMTRLQLPTKKNKISSFISNLLGSSAAKSKGKRKLTKTPTFLSSKPAADYRGTKLPSALRDVSKAIGDYSKRRGGVGSVGSRLF